MHVTCLEVWCWYVFTGTSRYVGDSPDVGHDFPPPSQRVSTWPFVSDIAIFVLKRDVKLQLTNSRIMFIQVILIYRYCYRKRSTYEHCIFVLWFVLSSSSSFFFLCLISAPQRSQIGCLPFFYTWCHLSANLECRSEMCCAWLAGNTGRKTTICFTALFPGSPGWASARRELLDFMVQGKTNRGRHTVDPAGHHSICTNQCPPPPFPPLFTGRMPFLPPNSVKALKA